MMKPLLLSLVCLFAVACEDQEGPVPDDSNLGGAGGSAGASTALCDVKVEAHAQIPSIHVDTCSPLGDDNYNSNPPSSGNHYGTWAAFQTYPQTFPRGFYVHSLEHGAVIFFYNCPDGCAADVAKLQAVIDALPVDPICTRDDPGGVQRRLILMPNPTIPTKFAASAWGWTLQSSCVDPASFDAFARAHYDQTYEPICYAGKDILALGIAATCGQ